MFSYIYQRNVLIFYTAFMFDNVAKTTTQNPRNAVARKQKVLVLFGTRPETIKLAPVIHELNRKHFQTIVVSSSQHKQLLLPFLETLEIDTDVGVLPLHRHA